MSNNNKSMGLFSAISIGMGGMIGASIFAILGVAITFTGNLVYLSFLIGGLVVFLCSYSYAKLGIKYPSAGGPAKFLLEGFGDGVLTGGINLLFWFGYIFALAVYAHAFGSYAAAFFPQAPHILVNIFGVISILIFSLINLFGAKSVGKSETVIISIIVGILLLFAAGGLISIKPSLLTVSNPDIGGIFLGAALLFLGYEGFGLITNTGADIKKPQVNIPRALYSTVSIVILIYIIVSIAVIGTLSVPAIVSTTDYTLAAAAKSFAGTIGFAVMGIGAILATSSAINATLYGGTKVSYLMAKNGELPSFFNKKTWEGAKEGLLITSALVIIITVSLDLTSIAMMSSTLFLLIYAGVNIAHIKIHKKTGAHPIILILGIMGCLSLFSVLVYYEYFKAPLTLIILTLTVAMAFLIEYLYRKRTLRTFKL